LILVVLAEVLTGLLQLGKTSFFALYLSKLCLCVNYHLLGGVECLLQGVYQLDIFINLLCYFDCFGLHLYDLLICL